MGVWRYALFSASITLQAVSFHNIAKNIYYAFTSLQKVWVNYCQNSLMKLTPSGETIKLFTAGIYGFS